MTLSNHFFFKMTLKMSGAKTSNAAIQKGQTKQLCAWVEQPGPKAKIELREIDIPTPGTGQVLVKLQVSGVWYVTLPRTECNRVE
jgi:hypothetical protein